MTAHSRHAARKAARLSDDLTRVLSQFRTSLRAVAGPDARLFLFGSYARGDQDADSDVDLMVVLPDNAATMETRGRIRDIATEFSLRTDYLLSLTIVCETLFHERQGFMVFGAVEREGIPL